MTLGSVKHGLVPSSSSKLRVLGRRWLAFKKSDDPIPFTQSEARKFRMVDDTLMQGEKDMKRGRYAVPLGLISFATLIYLGFIRQEPVTTGTSENTTEKIEPRDAATTNR